MEQSPKQILKRRYWDTWLHIKQKQKWPPTSYNNQFEGIKDSNIKNKIIKLLRQ